MINQRKSGKRDNNREKFRKKKTWTNYKWNINRSYADKVIMSVLLVGDRVFLCHTKMLKRKKRCFVTKTEANNTLDSDHPFENIISKPIFSLPSLGFISDYVNPIPGELIFE